MNTPQKIRVNMYKAVRNYFSRYQDILNNVVEINKAFNKLSGKVEEIEATGKTQGLSRKGFTERKKALRKQVTDLAIKNASKLILYGRRIANKVLLEEVGFKETDLVRLTEVTLVEKARIVWERTEENLQELSEQNVTAETQKTFLDVITAFNQAISMPRAEMSERIKATKTLEVLFSEADSAISDLDIAVTSVKDEHPAFVNGYKAARVLVDISAGTILIKGSAKEFLSGKPVGKATFKFSNTSLLASNGNGTVIKRTTVNGNFMLRSLEPGIYSVLVSKRGYKDKELSVVVNEGEKVDVKVELERA
jgi:hypothetical protein